MYFPLECYSAWLIVCLAVYTNCQPTTLQPESFSPPPPVFPVGCPPILLCFRCCPVSLSDSANMRLKPSRGCDVPVSVTHLIALSLVLILTTHPHYLLLTPIPLLILIPATHPSLILFPASHPYPSLSSISLPLFYIIFSHPFPYLSSISLSVKQIPASHPYPFLSSLSLPLIQIPFSHPIHANHLYFRLSSLSLLSLPLPIIHIPAYYPYPRMAATHPCLWFHPCPCDSYCMYPYPCLSSLSMPLI